MKKYNHVDVAVWITVGVLAYKKYMEIGKGSVRKKDMYFRQVDIRKYAQNICNKNVQGARISQWYNGDHKNSTHNYLRADNSLRRLTFPGEFKNVKEMPENLDLDDLLISIGITIRDLLHFLRNEYKQLFVKPNNNGFFMLLGS